MGAVRTKKSVFLPPENEVWGKIIFSEACVKNSVHRRGCLLRGLLCGGACYWGGGLLLGYLLRGGLLWGVPALGGGVPALEGGLLPGGCRDPPMMATAAGSTHPTGMHSFLHVYLHYVHGHLINTATNFRFGSIRYSFIVSLSPPPSVLLTI